MGTPPTFVAEYETTWNSTAASKTASVTVNSGDVLVIYAGTETASSTTLSTPTGGSLTYTLRQSVAVSNFCAAYAWTAVASSTQTFTFSVARAAGLGWWGADCLRFSNSGGVGTSGKANASGSAPTLNLTTTQDNSAIVMFNGDWNAGDGNGRTWRGAVSEQSYFFDSSHYTIYGGYLPDAGTQGAKTVGLTSPASQIYSLVAVEVLGLAATSSPKAAAGFIPFFMT